jgi:hypothetical protein
MSSTRHYTQIGALVSVGLWIIWDIYVASNRRSGDTESEVIRDFALKHPSFALAVGVLMGHFFWNVTEPIASWRSTVGLPVLGALALTIDLLGKTPRVSSVVPCLIGIVLGRLLWAQKIPG